MDSKQVLDFNQIEERLASFCPSVISKEMAHDLEVLTDRQAIQDALDETREAMQSIEREVESPLSGTKDIRKSLSKSRKGIILTREELWDIYVTIGAYDKMISFFSSRYTQYPLLTLWVQDMPRHDGITRKFDRMFDKKGTLLDNATPKLAQLRGSMSRLRDRIKSELQHILQDKANQKYFQEAIVTMRNDRYVIPVKQEYRYAFEGLIHDRSATGATLYIEPMKLVELNNDLQEATLAEEQEVLRIYKELTNLIKGNSKTLADASERASHVEFVYGKAAYALSLKATPAILSEGREVNLMNARHPLLPPEVVVPTTIVLGKDYRILLITGSNTGGKTVALKTLGILSLMNQCGLPIPAETGSTLPIFDNIYADIGDEQSIEASLSTFSAHMKSVIRIVRHVHQNDLILLDELGSGTDPEEGSALAVAIIEYLRKKGPLMMVSTHYNELKNYAYNTEGIENGHVEFDERTLRPTYRLHIGVAGSSHAFSIAARLGLPKDIVAMAREHRNLSNTSEMEDVLSDLNEQLRRTKDRERALKKELGEVRRLQGQVEREKKTINERKQRILTKAQEEAENMKRSIRVESEQIIKSLKAQFSENNAGKRQAAIQGARQKVRGIEVPHHEEVERKPLTLEDISVGSTVYVSHLQALGTVLAIQNKRIQVDVNGMTATVKLGDLKGAQREEVAKLERKEAPLSNRARKRAGLAVARQQAASTELNVIGKRVDEANVEVGRFIDQAILAGITSVRIVHGKGTGALRAGIHDYLKTLPAVTHFDVASYDEGGAGATVVMLK